MLLDRTNMDVQVEMECIYNMDMSDYNLRYGRIGRKHTEKKK